MASESMLEWALRYVRLGWPVFPLGVKSKAPMISAAAGGRGCLDATLNESQVREWWTKWPLANIGLATGHGWWALDIDAKKGGDETWDLIRRQYPRLPDTIEQTTGTLGRHILSAGMGEIKSCRKYENPIEFLATHKLWMDCNHRPRVTGTDDAIWSRLKCIPFLVRMERDDPEFDLKLIDKLRAEASGILAWAVRGALAWFEEGLGDPPEISQAGMEWREHDDPLKDFLDDCCEVKMNDDDEGEHYWVRNSDLSQCYAWWRMENAERFPLNREAFWDRIKAKGFKLSRSRRAGGLQMRTTEGLRIRDDVSKKISHSGGDPWKGLKE